jgi:hypothetical protein
MSSEAAVFAQVLPLLCKFWTSVEQTKAADTARSMIVVYTQVHICYVRQKCHSAYASSAARPTQVDCSGESLARQQFLIHSALLN